jgi:hypothetical protein
MENEMKLLITTQVYENYAWDENGKLGIGVDAYWKPKGGNDYVVKNFKGGDEAATMAVMALREKIECDNDAFREYVIDWEIVADDHLTEYEKDQLCFEGKVTFPPTELEYV